MKNIPKINRDIITQLLKGNFVSMEIFAKYLPQLYNYDYSFTEVYLATSSEEFIEKVEIKGQLRELYNDIINDK